MKKIALILLLASTVITASAQISFNVKGGLNLSRYMGEDTSNSNIKPGVKIGLGMEYQFNELFSIQPSLYFSQKGSKSSLEKIEHNYSSTTELYKKISINQMYLELPINAQFRFKIDRNTNFFVAAGPYFAYGVGGKMKERVEQIKNSNSSVTNNKIDSFSENGANIRPFDMGLNLGFGVEYNSFIAGIDSGLGFINLQDDVDMKNMNFSFMVGYKF